MNQKAPTIAHELKTLMQTAVARHRDGKLDEAEQLYRKYLAISPNNAHAWSNLGALLRARGLYEPSIAAHRKALQVDPGQQAARINLANALADHGCFEEAEILRREFYEADPDNRSGCATCARLCADWGAMARSSPSSTPPKHVSARSMNAWSSARSAT
jgi:predicted Zn-dependent protease